MKSSSADEAEFQYHAVFDLSVWADYLDRTFDRGALALVNIVRWLMILMAILLSPLYALWVGCGWIADQLEHKRWASRHIPS